MTPAIVFAVAVAATPAAGGAPSKEIQALKTRIERYFHGANDRMGGPRPYFLYTVSRDGQGVILNVRRADWEAAPADLRRASIADAKAWWKKSCLKPKRGCEIGIFDDKGNAIVPLPKSARVERNAPKK